MLYTSEDASHSNFQCGPNEVLGLKASSLLELPLPSNTRRLEGARGGWSPAISHVQKFLDLNPEFNNELDDMLLQNSCFFQNL